MDVKPNTYWVIVDAAQFNAKVFTVGMKLQVLTVENGIVEYVTEHKDVWSMPTSKFLKGCRPLFELKKEHSDGSTAAYYELPERARQLQDLISAKDMNAQIGEIFRSCFRYGEVAHSSKLRDAKKMRFYINEEIKRLEMYEHDECN